MKKFLLIFLVSSATLYGTAEVAAKNYAESAVAKAAAERDPLANDASAEVSFPFLFNLFTKSSINSVEISTNHVDLGPFITDKATAVMFGVHLDRGRSIRDRKPVVRSIDRAEMRVEIVQEQASRLLPEGFTFTFEPEVVRLNGPGFTVDGELVVSDDQTVAFKGDLPRGIPEPRIALGEIPFVSCVRDITVEVGRLIVACTMEDPPVDLLT